MKPDFALNLSLEGITLLRRAARGWTCVGEVGLDNRGLKRRLAKLREDAQSGHSGVFATKLILPESQVLYTSIESPGRDNTARVAAIHKALDGLTPYALDELVFDWEADGEVLHVAVVARETMDEAEAFAVEHQFKPVSTVARPKGGSFTGEPFFGETAAAAEILTVGETVDRDLQPTVVLQRAAKLDFRAPALDPVAAQVPESTPHSEKTAPGTGAAAETAADPAAKPVADAASNTTQDAPEEAPVEAATRANESAEIAPPVAAPGASAEDKYVSASVGAPKTPPSALDSSETDAALVPGDANAEAIVSDSGAGAEPKRAADGDKAAAAKPATGPEASHDAALAASSQEPDAEAPQNAALTPIIAGADRLAVTSGQLPPLEPEPDPAPFAARPLHAPARTSRPIDSPEAAAPVGFRKVLAQPRPIAGTRDQDDEGKALSVFGARLRAQRGPSPLTGIVLSAALLVVIAGAAIWLNTSGPPASQSGAEVASTVPAAPPQPEAAPLVAALPTPDPGPAPDAAAALLSEPVADTAAGLLPEPDRGADPGPGIAALPADPASTDAASAPDNLAEPEPEAPVSAAAANAPSAPASAARSEAEQAVAYAATGIWTRAPSPPNAVSEGRLDTSTPDAVDPRLPEAVVAFLPPFAPADSAPNPEPLPPPPGTNFSFNDLGLVAATPEGALTPGGTIVYFGRPAVTPAGRNGTVGTVGADEAEPPPGVSGAPAIRPRPRPSEFADRTESPANAGDPALAATSPATGGTAETTGSSTDPALDAAARAAAQAAAAVAAEDAPARGTFINATELAVVATPVPPARPSGFAARAARVAAAPPPVVTDDAEAEADGEADTIAPAAVAAAPPSGPQIPTRASVANQATIDNAIRLNQVNLIGIYGSASDRRALVRLASGRYVKVQVGDRVDGGQVAAISDRELRLVKNGRNIVLRVGG